MELKKVYIFGALRSQYGVVDHFIEELNNAFNRQGVMSRIIIANKDKPHEFLDAILNDPPDCTLSFNGLLPDEEGRFLCDLIKIPHVACLTDSPVHFLPLTKSPLTIITCVDRHFCEFFHGLSAPHVLFLPHAVANQSISFEQNQPLYDILMLNSFIDYEEIRKAWPTKYSPLVVQLLEDAAEYCLQELDINHIQSFFKTLESHLNAGKAIDHTKLDYETLLDDLEAYFGGRSRVELLQAIEDVPVHVFGSQGEHMGWKKYTRKKSNIHIHPPVPFKEALQLMSQAKIVLNCTPEIKQGTHERILNGLLRSGVLTMDSPFMREQFKDEQDILFFKPQKWHEVNRKIQTYLQDDEKRNQLMRKGSEKVLNFHTWDHRVNMLQEKLPPILNKFLQDT
jgi:spore maturation protein CgeB